MAPDTDTGRLPFASAADWERWLAENHGTATAIWVQIAKKGSGIPTVTYDEALDTALCYGWIDGQRKSHDEDHFIQRFTPRRPKGNWSKRNVAKVAELLEAGRMQPAGFAEVEAAQRDGRWEAAYDSQKDMVLPEDFVLAVRANENAAAFLGTLSRTNLYLIALKLHNARTPETRVRRFAALLETLERGEVPR
ncbi:bacteriocin-protection protein [bacterium]|nr:MAG: bacteriocin-protection protein [bacterium]